LCNQLCNPEDTRLSSSRRFVTSCYLHGNRQKPTGFVPIIHAEGRRNLLKKPSIERLLSIAEKRAVVRSRDFSRFGVHRQALKRAVQRGLLVRIDRGLYTRKDLSGDYKRRVMAACQRVPSGVVCLESALRFHGILQRDSEPIWMAIDRKARKPATNGLQLRFVRFSGQALTQGVINMRIDGEPIRVYSVAKTVADSLKYRRKIGTSVAIEALREGIAQGKCSVERLQHFAQICAVERLFRDAYSSIFNMAARKEIRPSHYREKNSLPNWMEC
jgi:predicted transcriptional regulator of viral defense system